MNRVSKEWGLALSLLVAAGALAYHLHEKNRMETAISESQKGIAEIRETIALKQFWQSKEMKRRLSAIQSSVPGGKMTRFEIARKKLTLSAKELSGRQLNRLLGKIAALPLQIEKLQIKRLNDHYRLECRCKW